MTFELEVNGQTRSVDVPPATPLIDVLREELGLTSPKIACGVEQCGACRVLVDGVPTAACRRPARELAGATITTLEGLADDPTTVAVQQALLDHNAGQCGYCLPGIVITLTALARAASNLDERAVARALDDHLCRCGSQPRILRAARAVLESTGGA